MPIVDEQTAKPSRESGSGAGRTVRLTIPAKPEYITLGRLALTGLARLRPISDEVLADLKLALTEATSNSVRHAYPDADGSVEITYELHGDRLADRGHRRGRGASTPPRTAEVDDLENLTEGGLGIAIIRSIADEFELGKGPGGPRLAAALRQSPHRLACSAATRQRRPQVARRLRVARDARARWTRSARSRSRSPAKRVVHLSATAFGGGVAEINYTLVPLMAGRRPRGRVADHPAAPTSSSTSRRRSTTRFRATRTG